MMAIPEAMSDDMREQFKRNQDRLEKLYEARSEQFRIAAERVHQAQKHNQMKNLLVGEKKKTNVRQELEQSRQRTKTLEDQIEILGTNIERDMEEMMKKLN
ncbi:hypothetical protein RFI_24628 [Reticulomyxa filosa]|uniref:Uncharacterized protein n=1 Tax=Reticulomyxa filosa TaxID=46433 RepID=X6MGF8_RETFI|nr:hypothetical protein RFI_24628 [Reticulomyxa filosa]|eukprot:ETO12746.1 hypothetical protein RFI_24628 [Reticulomyxa filosa]